MHETETLFVGRNTIRLDCIPSTNKFAVDLVSKINPSEGTCVITDFQTEGQGQIGRTWYSGKSENLTLSYIFYPSFLKASEQFLLSVVTSLAVVNTVRHYYADGLSIKWPNDIYVGDKKLAGILIQNQLSGGYLKNTVIGIGINVNQSAFPSGIPNPTSLFNICGFKLSLGQILGQLHKEMEKMYRMLRAGHHDYLRSEYKTNLYRLDSFQSYKFSDDSVFMGCILGVDNEGKLVIRMEDQSVRSFNFREISFVID